MLRQATTLVLLLLSEILIQVRSCRLNGKDIGICDAQLETDEPYRLKVLPFCGMYVRYSACVPKTAPLAASRDHPDGRWTKNTATEKDAWISAFYEKTVAERIVIEKDKQLQHNGVDEYGNPGAPAPRFAGNPDCRDAYKTYMCWANFPRCDETEESLLMCRSTCENMMIACRIDKDLWRCGDSEYMNGYEPEAPSYINGLPIYLRDYYPGQPFANNEFTDARKRAQKPLPVCTPSLDGSATGIKPHTWLSLLLVGVATGVMLMFTYMI